jgi:diamine N-acetyltransferase
MTEADPPVSAREADLDALATWASVTAGEDAAEGGAERVPRSVADGGVVALAEVTRANVRRVCRLAVAPDQRSFVAPNAVSLAEALVHPYAWYRVITADGVAVGFAMLSEDPTGGPDGGPEHYLWRLMIADEFQRRGYGRAALALVVEHVRSLPGAAELLVSWGPGAGSPEGFYLGLGFERTGDVEDGEIVGRLRL